MPLPDMLRAGLAHHGAGDLAQAERCYASVLTQDPTHPDARHLLGLVAHTAGDAAAAVRHIGEAVRLRPDIALFRTNLGTVQLAAGNPNLAETSFRTALALAPGSADAHANLGLALLRLDRPGEAEASLRAAINLAPDQADAHANLGAALFALGRNDAAADAYRQSLRLQPNSPTALSGLALVLAILGRTGDAEAHYRAALVRCPTDAGVHNNLGNLLRDLGRFDEAEAGFREALRLRPGDADTHSNLGITLAAAGRLAEAEAEFHAALRLSPDHADAHYNLGTTLLLGGRLVDGWAGFEYRWRRRGFSEPRGFAQPQWHGEPTGERVLLLHAEQGVGDSIQIARFIPAIARHSRVILEVPQSLLRLLANLPGVEQVIARGETRPAFDLHCPLMTLPQILGLTLEQLPGAVPYLRPDPATVDLWRHRLGRLPGRKIGLCWAGNPHYAADRRRSINPTLLSPLADIPGITLVSLQQGATAPGLRLHDWTAELDDFADTAALIAALDLVISVDTAVVHLAGAMGAPVWLLNRFDTCWRWLLNRDDSPWYPSLRLFRQPRPGDWASMLNTLGHTLSG